MSLTAQDVFKYAQENLQNPICALAFPIPNKPGKFTYHDLNGVQLPRTGADAVDRIREALVPFDDARMALSYYKDKDARIAFYHPSNKWLVQGDGLNPKVMEKAEFAPYTPFVDAEAPVAQFPVEALPETFRAYCKAAATSYQVDEAMVGCCVLSVLSAVFQKCGYWVQVSPDWREPINLYTMITAAPSERKSPVLRDAMTPLTEALDSWNETKAEQIEWQKKKIEVLKKKADNITTSIAKRNAKVTEADLKAAQAELREAEKEMLTPEQWLVDDTTPEALALVLRDNAETAALLSGEGGSILGILAGRYSAPGSGANIDIFLKGYSVEPTMIHRIGRQTVTLKHPRLTVLLMAQPSLLQDFVSNDSFSGRGLCARFLYCFPKSQVGNRAFRSEPVPEEVRADYENSVKRLTEYALDWDQQDTILTVSPEASTILEQYHDSIEPSRPEMSEVMQAWSGKLEGGVVRIAALLYLAKNKGIVGEIGADSMRGAIELGKYFTIMSEYALGFTQDSQARRDAVFLLKRLSGDSFKEYRKSGFIKRRDLFAKIRGSRFKDVRSLEKGLDELAKNGYIAQIEVNDGKSGRPSTLLIFNPEAFPDAPGLE